MKYVYLLMHIVDTENGPELRAVTYDGVSFIFSNRDPKNMGWEDDGDFLMAVPVDD